MKLSTFLFRATLVAAIVLASPSTQAQERILDYHSDIQIQADSSVEVTERIRVRSERRNIRRGIYRDFPTRYRDRYGNRVVVDFEVLEVLRDGQPEPWFTERRHNGIRVNTGDDRLLPGTGEYTFSIRYRTNRQLGFFDQHDELYWNVTGLGWAFAIERASARVTLPRPVDPAELQLDSYTGPHGATTSQARGEVIEPGVVEFETARSLPPGHGLTIAVGFPKGIVDEPTMHQRLAWLLYDNRGLLILLLALAGVTLFYFRSWLKHGRGPEPGIIIARYEPPEGYSPAGLRYVMRKSYDLRCLSADLVELGVKGLLRIHRDQTGRRQDWTLEQVADQNRPDDPPSQVALFPALFANGRRLELKDTNASTVQKAMAEHHQALSTRYKGAYIEPNAAILAIGWILSILIGIGAFVLAAGDGLVGMIVVAFLLLVVNLVFSALMPAPTETGRRLLDQIEGLKMYLSVAESDDLKQLEHRDGDQPELTSERFEALLPYALALDVEDAWTGKFTSAVGEAAAEQTRQRMHWYTGSGASLGGLGGMSQSLGSSLSSTISSSSSPPGSSSGSGGGGFSGGGGGGGGGGGR